MTEQISISYEEDPLLSHHCKCVKREMSRVIAHVGLQEAAHDLDVKPSMLAHAMAERERKYPRADWVVYCLIKDPGKGLAQALMDAPGLDVADRIELTPAQKVARLEQAVRSLGSDVASVIMSRAYGDFA